MYTPTSQAARLIIATATITQIPKVDCVVRTASTIAGPPTSTIHPATYPPRPPRHHQRPPGAINPNATTPTPPRVVRPAHPSRLPRVVAGGTVGALRLALPTGQALRQAPTGLA